MPNLGAYLAIDYGKAKTGLAVGHPLTGSAQPLEPLKAKTDAALVAALAPVIKAWQPAVVVLGLPLGPDGHDTVMSQAVRAFAASLALEYPNLNIVFHDERMTSMAAASAHAERRQAGRARAKDAAKLDSMAASLILESWMSATQKGQA